MSFKIKSLEFPLKCDTLSYRTCVFLTLSNWSPHVPAADPIRSHGDTVSDGSEERPAIDPCADGAELKAQLRKHYGGYLSGVKQEHLRKRKKGKLPADATTALHKWWKGHYKWPYPSVRPPLLATECTWASGPKYEKLKHVSCRRKHVDTTEKFGGDGVLCNQGDRRR